MTIEAGSYLDFSSRIHSAVSSQRLPISVTMEITRRCPLECKHCYNNLPMTDGVARQGELSVAEYDRLLAELADVGCLWLCFTGGEIFARRDFLEIYGIAKQRGFIVTLFTNGTIITPKIADALAASPPFAIEITLYGATKETYERVTGIPGSYDRCRRGIDLLRERGLPLALKTVALTLNRHEVWDMKRLATEDLKLPFKFDAMMTPRIDCSASPLAVRLTPEEVVAFDLSDDGRMKEWKTFSSNYLGPVHPAGKENEVYHCGGGINSFAVDPAGKMSICVLSHQDTYDLRSGTILDGWDHFLKRVRERTTTRVTKCTACQLKNVCGMCPANGELEMGDPESPVDFLCHTAHLRAETMSWPVPPHGDCEYCAEGEHRERVKAEAVRLRKGTTAAPARLAILPTAGQSAAAAGCSIPASLPSLPVY